MLFEELIKQHRVDGFIAHTSYSAVPIVHYEIGVPLGSGCLFPAEL